MAERDFFMSLNDVHQLMIGFIVEQGASMNESPSIDHFKLQKPEVGALNMNIQYERREENPDSKHEKWHTQINLVYLCI